MEQVKNDFIAMCVNTNYKNYTPLKRENVFKELKSLQKIITYEDILNELPELKLITTFCGNLMYDGVQIYHDDNTNRLSSNDKEKIDNIAKWSLEYNKKTTLAFLIKTFPGYNLISIERRIRLKYHSLKKSMKQELQVPQDLNECFELPNSENEGMDLVTTFDFNLPRVEDFEESVESLSFDLPDIE